MKKRYIVLLDSTDEGKDKAFLDFIRENKFGYWHWISNTWLLTESRGNSSAKEIRDFLLKSHPDITTFVIELDEEGDDTWSGFGPNGEDQNMFEWVNRNWS